MRPNGKRWWENYCYLLIIFGVMFIIVKVIMGPEKVEDETEMYANSNSDSIVVPISQIMSGKPYILPQDDTRIIKYLWSTKHLRPPSNDPYNLEDPSHDPSMGQGQFIRKILKNMTNGFFVECGALDGETRSNTLFMEMHLHWKGLLIEGDPSNFALMKNKNRKAWTSNTCLAVKPYPHTTEFRQSFNTGKVLDSEKNEVNSDERHVKVQCMPLFSLLSALNVTTVDYFSLDVEGNELQVLKTIPFDKVYIRTLSVEFIHTEEGKGDLHDFMISQGYRKVGEVRHPNNLANDLMFVHKDVEI